MLSLNSIGLNSLNNSEKKVVYSQIVWKIHRKISRCYIWQIDKTKTKQKQKKNIENARNKKMLKMTTKR